MTTKMTFTASFPTLAYDDRTRTNNTAATVLEPPRHRRLQGRGRGPLRLLFRSLCRSLPILTTPSRCLSVLPHSPSTDTDRSRRVITGTLFGRWRGRVNLCVQESPRRLPWLVVEMAVQTQVVMRELGAAGTLRMALECEKGQKKSGGVSKRSGTVMEEAMWPAVFCNGRKCGYGVRRDATAEDLALMELLRSVSMGAGVLPATDADADADTDVVAYVRGRFEHVEGSGGDSEALYMLSTDSGSGKDNFGPDLTIFFIRI